MINSSSATSAATVNRLVALERAHLGVNAPRGYQSGWCWSCYPHHGSPWLASLNRESKDITCRTLIKARESSLEETLIAVALMLNGEKR